MKSIYLFVVLFALSTMLYSVIIDVPDDYPTIQEGIDAAADTDTVLVAEGTYYENIDFNGMNITVASLFLTTQDTTHISQTVIDGSESGVVVTFNSGENSSALLTGFTITNGFTNNSGGGILCDNSNPTLTNLTITGNATEHYGYGSGGGICMINGCSSELTDLVISNNEAGFGGGIYCSDSSPNLSNVAIIENLSSHYNMHEYNEGFGGGIFCYNSDLQLIDTVISSNNAGNGDGGGIYYSLSTALINNVEIINNTGGLGGGIFCTNSNTTISNVNIAYNTANGISGGMGGGPVGEGGGIYFCGSDPILSNVVVSYNSSNFIGGGISFSDSSPTLQNVTIAYNTVYANEPWSAYIGAGGGISFSDSNPTLSNVTISHNSALSSGGIYCDSDITFENLTVTGNSAVDGGGIYLANSSPSFSSENRCNIYSNNVESRGYGADIFAVDCDAICVIVDTFTVMTPTDYYASPIDIFTFDILYGIQDTLINSDLFVSVDGNDLNSGISADEPLKTIKCALMRIYTDSLNQNTIFLMPGIYSPDTNGEIFPIGWSNYLSLEGSGAEVTILDANSTNGVMRFNFISDSTIRNVTVRNGSANYGGGIYLFNSNPSLENVTVINGSANYGGGIYLFNSNPSLENITVINNSAVFGGGIYLYNSNPSIENVTIANNSTTAFAFGGGIHCWSSTALLKNITMTENIADYGGGIYCSASNPTLMNITMTGNIALYGGGINAGYSSNPVLINTILWNDAQQEIYFRDFGDPNSITLSYSDIQGGEAGIVTNNNGTVNWLEGNIDEDPLFVNPIEENYHLQDTSPCIGAGIDEIEINGIWYYAPEFDIEGNPRPDPVGSMPDMGAYENPNGEPQIGIDDNLLLDKYEFNNYPNPFNPETTIQYSIPQESKVELNIYNIKGQKVKTLVNEMLEVGKYTIIWDGKDDSGKLTSSGIYFYKLKSGNFEKIRKMILLR